MTKPDMQGSRTAIKASLPGMTPGLLVLLAGAEARGKDLLIATARRRYAGDPRLEFPARLQTRACTHDAEHIGVPRRVFRDIEANRGFAVAWMGAGERYGLTAGALESLEAGRIVVLAIPHDAVASFKDLWPNVEVVALGCDVDDARPRLRTAAPVGAHQQQGGAVRHSGDIAEAVRRFHRVLDEITRRQFTIPAVSR
jgi:ribose 1,5-bisphosphokinase